MSFFLGTICWHVRRPGDSGLSFCGRYPDEWGYPGNEDDVRQSEMPVCKTCAGARERRERRG